MADGSGTPPADLPSLSTELTGVLASVLQSLNDRVQVLEESLADERAGKLAAESALAAAAEQIRALDERLSSTEESQKKLLESAEQMENSFESGLAGMLNRLDETDAKAEEAKAEAHAAHTSPRTADGTPGAEATKPGADAAEVKPGEEAADAAEKPKGMGWMKLRSSRSNRASTAAQLRAAVDVGLKAASEKRKQGVLFKEWTENMEKRLLALEANIVSLSARTADEEAIAKRGAQLAAEAMRQELAEQVAIAVEKSTYASKKEAKARLDAQDARLSAATERSDIFAADMSDSFVRVRAEASHAAKEAREAYIKAQEASASSAELAHMRDRVAEMNDQVVKLRVCKVDKEEMSEFYAMLTSEAEGRLSTLEHRVIKESDEKLRATQQHVDERLDVEIADSSGALEQMMASRLSLLDSKMARKLDAAQEYARLQQNVVDGTGTNKRLREIKKGMALLLELILQIEDKPSSPPPSP